VSSKHYLQFVSYKSTVT